MKKIILIIGLLIFTYAQENTEKDIFLEYTNKLVNYEFNLDDINKVKSPIYEAPKYFQISKNDSSLRIKKRIKITLLSILENRAYIKVEEFLGEQRIKVEKKWISINKKIYDCKLLKLTETDAIFKCGNKTLYKTINKKIPMLRDKK